ncbi:Rho GTPase-activating protein [Teratosphaeriaceae sp. CCFEE 6253]|nr:Rho GTPase-activating protein [Teratosphaeriaceae sp. CCFEE 6253]
MSSELNRTGSLNGSTGPVSPSSPPADTVTLNEPAGYSNGNGNGTAAVSREMPKQVEDVMYSDIGINTLLNRLKQSVASARDFASFLQKRSKLDEEQAIGLKKLAGTHLESLLKSEMRGGSYAAQVSEVMRVHERMAENGNQFAMSLHQMHEDLNSLTANMERGRKVAKHEGLEAEKRASDAEASMAKARIRYDALAEDYDRARTGDTKGSRRMGLKGPKSQEQYESELQRKVQSAETEYEERVRTARTLRESLVSSTRPKFVRQLQELCKECDAGVTLQLQKFAAFNEKLLLGNGIAVSPLGGDAGSQKSLRDVVYEIDNERDFHSYIGALASKIPRPTEIKYEQHPTLITKTQQPSSRNVSSGAPPPSQPPVQQPTLSVNTSTPSQPDSMNSRYSASQAAPGPLMAPNSAQAYSQPSYTQPTQPASQAPTYAHYDGPQFNSQQRPPRADTFNAPPYPTEPTERSAPGGGSGYPPQQSGSGYPPQQSGSGCPPQQSGSGYPPQQSGSGYPPQQTMGTIAPGPPAHRNTLPHQPSPTGPASPAAANLPPLRPTFGVSLQDLFDRDQSAVPMVVIQCILAVDHFGLETTGIYRQSGTQSHVARLIGQFNHNPNSTPAHQPPRSPVFTTSRADNLPPADVDFRNPAAFYHDVHIPATLLKQFFKQLPDPLFTHAAYQAFIDASRQEEENARRDGLHALINELPDPNYATLRALILHLHRVTLHEGKNRMGSGNLGVCFAYRQAPSSPRRWKAKRIKASAAVVRALLRFPSVWESPRNSDFSRRSSDWPAPVRRLAAPRDAETIAREFDEVQADFMDWMLRAAADPFFGRSSSEAREAPLSSRVHPVGTDVLDPQPHNTSTDRGSEAAEGAIDRRGSSGDAIASASNSDSQPFTPAVQESAHIQGPERKDSPPIAGLDGSVVFDEESGELRRL